MTPLFSRILVVIVLLPAALALVWLGGWWIWTLALAVGLVALHEYFSMIRPLRPLVLGGYAGLVAALLGVQLGGLDWLLAGFLSTLAFSFLLQGVAGTRAATVAIGSTLLGVGWIGLGLGHILLLRGIETYGELAAFALLLTVFAADAVAYFAGQLVGSHKLAPVISPGKTWEGFLAGTLAGVFVAFVWLYADRNAFLGVGESLVLGAVIVLTAALGDLFESTVKRDMQVKDSGRLLGAHGGMLDRLDALLFAGPAAFYLVVAFGHG